MDQNNPLALITIMIMTDILKGEISYYTFFLILSLSYKAKKY